MKLRLTELENKIVEFGNYIKTLSDNPNVTRHQLEIDTTKKVINLNCSCYTRECTTDPVHGKYNRQEVYKGIVACLRNSNEHILTDKIHISTYPFGDQTMTGYNVNMVPHEDNPHDPNAEMLILDSAEHVSLKKWHGYNIGYIPGSMSEFFHIYRKYFTNIKIHTIYNNLPNKKQTWNPLHNLRLSIFYRDTPLYGLIPGMGRFKSFE